MNWTDPDNGWRTSAELVEDTVAIGHYTDAICGKNGCVWLYRSRAGAPRRRAVADKTELLETRTVDFELLGAEGLRRFPGDVIEVCDGYAGIGTGGRILSVDRRAAFTTHLTGDYPCRRPAPR
ncbi:hypothetical protein KCP73_04800 [Salmonella enterica subsp. enterica]|nr:hypothetical protein KCP73_04800 [Salmonella enterica subsp. enterica]